MIYPTSRKAELAPKGPLELTRRQTMCRCEFLRVLRIRGVSGGSDLTASPLVLVVGSRAQC